MKPVKDFEGVYSVSEDGKVWSHKANKFIKPFMKNNGYLFVKLFKQYDATAKKRVYAYRHLHRVVAEAYLPNPNNLPCVNHIDGNKLNNSVENLEWCSRSQNMQHAVKTGLLKVEKKVTDLEPVFQDYISLKFLLSDIEGKYSWFIGSKLTDYLYEYAIQTNRIKEFLVAKENQKKLKSQALSEKLSKKVAQYSLEGDLIKIWDSSIEAAKALQINQGNISNVCTGKAHKTGGFKWAYI